MRPSRLRKCFASMHPANDVAQTHRVKPPECKHDNENSHNPKCSSFRHPFSVLSVGVQLATNAWQIVIREVRNAGTTLATIAIAIDRTSQTTGPKESK